MKEEKKINSGVVLLICMLFIVIIAMCGWILVDKIQKGSNEKGQNIELSEEDIKKIEEEFTLKFKDACYEVSPDHAEDFNFTDDEIKQLKEKMRNLMVETTKKIKNISGDISDDKLKKLYLLSDKIIDGAITISKSNAKIEKEIKEATNGATIANIKNTLALSYANAVTRGITVGANGIPVNESGSVMTKEDYIKELKKKFTDEQIKLVEFNVDSNGLVKYGTGESSSSNSNESDYQKYLTNMKNNREKRTEFADNLNASYNVTLEKNGSLYIGEELVDTAVIDFFLIHSGNGGYNSVYYIKEDGSVYKTNSGVAFKEKIPLEKTKLNYEKIVSIKEGGKRGVAFPIFIDIEGKNYSQV